MPSLTELSAASSVEAADQLVVNQSGTDKRVTANKFGIVGAANQWMLTQEVYARVGARATKTGIAHGTSVTCFGIGLQAYGNISGSFLITLTLSGTGRLATQTYLVTMAYSTVTVTKLSEALFAFSSVALYASVNTSTAAMAFTINQSNPGAEAVTCNFDVLPLAVGTDGYFGLSVA